MKNNQLKAKTFFNALREFHENPHKVQKYFKDKRPTQSEKKILECWFLFRNGKHSEIIDTLEKMPSQADELVESQKHLILGLAYNNQGRFLESVDKIEKAVSILKQYDLPYYLFNAECNLFNAYLNLKNRAGMKSSIHELRNVRAQNPRQDVIYKIMRMTYFSFCGRYRFAEKQIAVIDKMQPVMNESISIYYLTTKLMHALRVEDVNRADKILKDMKQFRKFHFNSNFKFMRMMLDHLMSDKPLYVYQQDFENSPMLYHQISTIRALEESNRSEAEQHWEKLRKIQPGVYGDNFQYHGDPCLISLCLKRHQQKNSTQLPLPTADMPKEKWLYTILREVDRPIRKDELFFLIWGKKDADKDDLNKLKVLISRTREKYSIEIGYKKGCYQLIKAGQKKSA